MRRKRKARVRRYLDLHNGYHSVEPGTPEYGAAVNLMRELENRMDKLDLRAVLVALHPSVPEENA